MLDYLILAALLILIWRGEVINRILVVLKTQNSVLITQGKELLKQGEQIMSRATELKDALDNVQKEVGETATEVQNLKQMIEDLKNQQGNTPELEAAIDAAVVKAGEIASALDTIQPHDTPAEPPVAPPTGELTDAELHQTAVSSAFPHNA